MGDNLPLHLAVEAAQPGEVLMVNAGGATHGYWGEILTVAAQQRGIHGLVIDGGVRDTERLESLGFPTFSTAIALRGTAKEDPGTIGEPIQFGDVTVAHGDIVVDRDGVVVLPQGQFATILNAARARQQKEEEFLGRIRGGELTIDLYGFPRNGRAAQ